MFWTNLTSIFTLIILFTVPTHVSHFITGKATCCLCGNEDTVAGAFICEVNVTWGCDVGVEHNLNLTAERSDVSQIFFLESKCDGVYF